MLRLLSAARRDACATRPEGAKEAEPSSVSPGLTRPISRSKAPKGRHSFEPIGRYHVTAYAVPPGLKIQNGICHTIPGLTLLDSASFAPSGLIFCDAVQNLCQSRLLHLVTKTFI